MTQPLTAMLRSKTAYRWGKDERQSFEALKSAVVTGTILKQPDFDAARTGALPFLFDTDASDYALGGVLSQMDSVGNDRPIYFHSRKFTRAETNYTTTKREGLAVPSSVLRFRAYVLGTKMVIQTDHSALAFMFRSENLTGRIAQWVCLLSEYDFKIVTRQGKSHLNADGLSQCLPKGGIARPKWRKRRTSQRYSH